MNSPPFLQVPLWETHDVYYWVKHVLNLPDYAQRFRECHVDGDLLLRMTEEALVRSQKNECQLLNEDIVMYCIVMYACDQFITMVVVCFAPLQICKNIRPQKTISLIQSKLAR